MSRAQANKLYSNFSRGLITEASYLAFPENATTDELNCDIQENGVRVRRYGFDVNGTWTAQTFTGGVTSDSRVHSFMWRSVNKDADVNFLVVQIFQRLYFHQITGESSFTTKSFNVNLSDHLVTGATVADINNNYCSMTSGKGVLYVAHPKLEPIRVEYDPVGDSITVSEITIKIRDFIGLDDGLAVDEEPTTLSDEHHYNLRNQGWIDPEADNTGTSITSYDLFGDAQTYSYPTTTGPIAEYFTAESRYPGNNKVWWSAKDSNGDFDPAALTKLFFGNTRAPRGHFILDAFNKDYSAVSGISGITAVTEDTRPRSVEFFSGRVFWAHKSDIYFSPILEDGSRAGQCFQEADPTSENISDLVQTDGGFIPFPNAEEIVQLQEMGDGIVIFATNGVWFLTGGDAGFSASDYTIYKISEIGTQNARSVVKADNQLFWWSDIGIHAMSQSIGQFGPIAGQFDNNNITDSTIKTFYNNISRDGKEDCIGLYDPASSKIVWLYKQDATKGNSVYERLLWYDLELQAFVPWEVLENSVEIPSANRIVNAFVSTEFATNTEDKTFLEFLCFTTSGIAGSPEDNLRLSNFVDQEYGDWASRIDFYGDGSVIGVGIPYESYLITGFEILGDGLRFKQTPIVGAFFKRTEDTVTDEGGGEYSIDNPSSCFFQTRWDYANSDNGNWSRSVQAYRPKAIPFVDPAAPSANTGFDVVYSKNKVRGQGRAVQFKFSESQAGHGFELLGWHVFYGIRVNP